MRPFGIPATRDAFLDGPPFRALLNCRDFDDNGGFRWIPVVSAGNSGFSNWRRGWMVICSGVRGCFGVFLDMGSFGGLGLIG